MDGSGGVAEQEGISCGVGFALLSGFFNGSSFSDSSGLNGGSGNRGNEGESSEVSKTVSVSKSVSVEGGGVSVCDDGSLHWGGVDERGSGIGDDGGDVMDNGLANGINETILVQILGEAFKSIRAKSLGGGDEVAEGCGEGSGGSSGVKMDLVDGSGGGSQARGDKGKNNLKRWYF